MKILLANYRYFISSGPERYMFNLMEQFVSDGHEIVPFSIRYAKNLSSPFARYFVEPLGAPDEIYFAEHKKSFRTYIRTLSRLFYSSEVEKSIDHIVDEHKPHIAYILQYLRKLSPALLVGLKKRDIPIVVRLSDYSMLCPQSHGVRGNKPCTLCFRGRILPSLKYHCVKGSFAVSALNLLATWYHRQRCFFDLIDCFVCTNNFMYRMMLEAGYPANRLVCIPTFTNLKKFIPEKNFMKSDYIAYCGRLPEYKGINVLLKAMALLKKKNSTDIFLKIAATGERSYLKKYKRQIIDMGLDDNIEIVWDLDIKQLSSFLAKAKVSIVPSLWFENLPNVLIESLACGTPVIASDLGSLQDSIEDGRNGFLFEAGNASDLAEKIAHCLKNESLLHSMAINARTEAELKYSEKEHIEKLTRLFRRLV